MENVRVQLTNRHAYLCPPYPRDEIKEFFSAYIPGAEFSDAYKLRGWDGCRKYLRGNTVGAGLFLARKSAIEEELGITFQVEEQLRQVFTDKLHNPAVPITPRRAQEEGLAAMKAATVGGLILQATGTGKTALVGLYCNQLDGDAVFVVDEIGLAMQTKEELGRILNEEIGVVGMGEFEPRRVTVATVQTLGRNLKSSHFKRWWKNLSVVVIDEIHKALNRRQFDIVRKVDAPLVFGLTATLEMEKDHIAYDAQAVAGPVLYTYDYTEGVEDGVLAPGLVVQARFNNPIQSRNRKVKYPMGIVHNDRRNDLVREFVKVGMSEGETVVVMVERVDHIHNMSEMLAEEDGHNLRLAYGGVPKKTRTQIRKDLQAGKISLVVANRVFFTGIDVRGISMIVDATAASGENTAMQRFGRGARVDEGKEGLLYIDIADEGGGFDEATEARRKAYHKYGLKVMRMRGSAEWCYRRGKERLRRLVSEIEGVSTP